MTKYRSKKAEVLGISFDSKMEADYYRYLLAEKSAGRILAIDLQPEVVLQPKFRFNGKMVRAITYTPDFLVRYSDGRQEYIDIKGMSTQQGELKRKMYIYIYEHQQNGIPLRWIAASKKYSATGWIDWFELQAIRRRNRIGQKKTD